MNKPAKQSRIEKKISSILNNNSLNVERKISQLTILALKSFPSSLDQIAAQVARESLRQAR